MSRGTKGNSYNAARKVVNFPSGCTLEPVIIPTIDNLISELFQFRRCAGRRAGERDEGRAVESATVHVGAFRTRSSSLSRKSGTDILGSFWPSSRIYVPSVSACRAKMILLLFLPLLLFAFRHPQPRGTARSLAFSTPLPGAARNAN